MNIENVDSKQILIIDPKICFNTIMKNTLRNNVRQFTIQQYISNCATAAGQAVKELTKTPSSHPNLTTLPLTWSRCYKTFFSSKLMSRPNKLEHLYLAIPLQPSLTFAGNTRSLLKKKATERCPTRVGSGLARKFLDQTGKGCQGLTFQLIRPCHQE